MSAPVSDPLDVPPNVRQVLEQFVSAAGIAFANNLRSIVLYGSAAEGRLRPTSDVNLLVVLDAFEAAQAERFSETLRLAQAAVALRPMFLLESEIPRAAAAFSQKFDDIARRRRILFGADPFATLQVSRDALRARLLQTTLNLALRLRAGYVARSHREEQLALLVADAAGPLRAAAASLLEIEGRQVSSPKEALETVAAEEQEPAETLSRLSRIREAGPAIEPGVAAAVALRLMALAEKLYDRAERAR